MATVQRIASAVALVALIPASGLTQSSNHFKDSWFWGVKGGVISFSTATVENRTEPVVGGEWLLTRSQGALYIAYDQALFDATSAFTDTLGQSRTVTIKDMRRLTGAAMAFPFAIDASFATIRPYAGAGFALNFLRSAQVVGGLPTDSAARKDVSKRLEDQQDRAAPVLILGLQLQVGRLAGFIQGTAMPAETRFLLNGRPTFFAEVGVRFNAGSSRDPRMR
jgi:hypothetical protein